MRPTEDFLVAAALPKARLGGAGVFSHLDYLFRQQVDETYFSGPHQRLFRAAIGANIQQTPLDDEVLRALLVQQGAPADEVLQCQIMYRDLDALEVPLEKVKVLLPEYRERVHADRMAVALEEAAVVMTEGLTIDGKKEQGYKAARTHIISRLAELDRRESGALPVENIRMTTDAMRKEYEESEKGQEPGILTGFREIDTLTNGFQRSELAIFCAYTGEGKTNVMLGVAWHAAVMQQKNVVFVSLEMPVPQVRRRIITRHTNHDKFGLPGGLDYTRIKKGTLDSAEKKMYWDVLADWGACPDYGALTVMQLSKYDTIKVLGEKLTYHRSQHPVDLLVLDYASLLSASRRRSDKRDEIVEVIEGLKELALTFNDGEGLCVVSANQISRKAREDAEREGHYGLSFASETSAIEKNADFLAWLLRTEEMKASHEVLMGIAKYRDGDVGTEFRLLERYASSYLADLHPGVTNWGRAA